MDNFLELRRPQQQQPVPPKRQDAAAETAPMSGGSGWPPEVQQCPYRLLDRSHECALSSPLCERRQHRRSKSHEEEGAPCRGWHHHYRHRERDLERQRAMRQVASWIEREHLAGLDCSAGKRPERHEHHHLHEHVHHHYHHYVDWSQFWLWWDIAIKSAGWWTNLHRTWVSRSRGAQVQLKPYWCWPKASQELRLAGHVHCLLEPRGVAVTLPHKEESLVSLSDGLSRHMELSIFGACRRWKSCLEFNRS